MERCLEACYSCVWNGRDLTTYRAWQEELSLLVSVHQTHKALLAVGVETLEQLGVDINSQTDRTVELIFYLLEDLLSHL